MKAIWLHASRYNGGIEVVFSLEQGVKLRLGPITNGSFAG